MWELDSELPVRSCREFFKRNLFRKFLYFQHKIKRFIVGEKIEMCSWFVLMYARLQIDTWRLESVAKKGDCECCLSGEIIFKL